MKIAIIGRMKNKEENKPFNKEYVLNNSFREIFDELGILLIPVISNKNLDEICAMCDGLVLTGGINVIFGGTLYQKIDNHFLENGNTHKAKLNKESFLYKVYNKELIDINSYHRQAIKNIAPNFKITAISEDGIIEAIEKDNIIAVQWHPEILKDTKFFKVFIEEFLYSKNSNLM